jgi:cyanophycinase-like exopeptidase
MGRMNTFMSRILKDVDSTPPALSRAVGIDEHTALLLDINSGDISAVGVGTAYVCESNHQASVCKSSTPLTFQGKPVLFLAAYDILNQ